MRRVIKLLLACAAVAVPLHLADAIASPSVPGHGEYANAEQALSAGRIQEGLAALEVAANANVLSAQIRLGRILSEGVLAAKDEVRACKLFESAVDGHPGYDKLHPQASTMGEAYRLLGQCYLRGAPATGWERDPTRAAELFLQAGVIFDDAPGLFELAQLYLKGEGVRHNPRLAISFLYSAARKRYAPAYALLGDMMWQGQTMKREPAKALALIIVAKEITSPPEYRGWIDRMYEDVRLLTTKEDEYVSVAIARNMKKAYGLEEGQQIEANSIPPAIPVGQPTPPTQAITVSEDVGAVPLPVKAPWRQEQNYFGSMPTGASVPESASPVQP